MDVEYTPIGELPRDAYNWVVNSWVRSWQKQQPANMDNELYFATFPAVARRIAGKGDVVVAHLSGAPDLFVGWVAVDRQHPNRLHYVYVKQSFRRMGVANRLLKTQLHGAVQTSLQPTHAWKRSKASALGFRYNPYLLMTIGDNDGGEKEDTGPDPRTAGGPPT